ncbi:hypothetical protein LLB_3311 [Legionella longbeachae D-4968]|nr:hypothetical protein LLB_3311 [Legionella longbeachae D-4968]
MQCPWNDCGYLRAHRAAHRGVILALCLTQKLIIGVKVLKVVRAF